MCGTEAGYADQVAVMHRILAKAEKIVKEEEGLGGGGASSQRKGAEEEVGGINHEEYLDKLVRHLVCPYQPARRTIVSQYGCIILSYTTVATYVPLHVPVLPEPSWY